ncbi:MAG TPA: hypothetical protein VEX36_11965 [Thermoleophilaceae bacterium]|nr:hypothetical protein [Thermoleophilaceae bacterium]
MFDHSPRKANISLLVFAVLLTLGYVIVRPEPGEAAYQVVVWTSIVAAFCTLFGLYYREDRARARAERDQSDGAPSERD